MKSSTVFTMCAVVAATVVAILLQTTPHTNSGSRFATVESLVNRGTFAIDDSPFSDTVDKVMIGDHAYSSKPPMLPTLAAAIYFLFSKLTGITFTDHPTVSIAFINVIFGLIPYLLLLYFFRKLLEKLFNSRRTVNLGILVFTFNFIGLGYATDFTNHVPSAACLLAAFYFAFEARHDSRLRRSPWILAGFLGGLASTFEFWAGFFTLAFLVYLFSANPGKTLRLFLPAAALTVAAHFALNLAATGSLLPVYLRPELYRFGGSYWNEPTGIDSLSEPKHVYFFHILLGHHGIFSMTPVFLPAVLSIVSAVKNRTNRMPEALTIGVPTLAVLLFLGFRTRNYGGVCAGLRWMILAMPLLFVFVAQWIEEHRSGRSMALLAFLFLVGFANMADVPWANAGPWHNSAWHKHVFGLYP